MFLPSGPTCPKSSNVPNESHQQSRVMTTITRLATLSDSPQSSRTRIIKDAKEELLWYHCSQTGLGGDICMEQQLQSVTRRAGLRVSGMPGYVLMWSGQVVSLLGTAMTNFAVGIWLWETTGRATPFAINIFASMAPLIFVGPIAGALVDRWDRKLTMALSDVAACIGTATMLLLHFLDALETWHLYALSAFTGVFGAFQFPAFSAAVTMMVPKRHYARASAMRSMAETGSGMLAPVLAAMLLGSIGIRGVFLVDIATFATALATLLLVHVPRPPMTTKTAPKDAGILRQSVYGFKYVAERPSLLGMLLVFLVMNITLAYTQVLRSPLILSRTGGNELALGTVQAATATGGLVGGLLMVVWGGPKAKARAILAGMAAMGAASAGLGLGTGVVVWAVSGFCWMVCLVVTSSTNQALWQAKVAPDVQGRVFAARSLVSGAATPLAIVSAGPLADRIFEPQFSNGGWLRSMFGGLVGTGPGSGIALLYVFAGALALLTVAIGYAMRTIRDVETILPDHEAVAPPM